MSTILLLMFSGLFVAAHSDISDILQHPDLPGLDKCGYNTNARIVGGVETKPGEFPWMAAIEYKNINTQQSLGIKCVGSIVNNRYILTAGHCINPPDAEMTEIWLGVWKISTAETTDKDKVKKFGFVTKFTHPSYKHPFVGYDIGLVKLDANIAYTDYIRPICLPKQDLALPPIGTQLTVAGWGTTESGSRSDVKLKVDVPVAVSKECASAFNITMVDTQMCVGGEDGKDSCNNDSGAPLMARVRNPITGKAHWYPHGLVSFGLPHCGTKDVPSVYSAVSKFSNWIVSQVK